MRFLQHAVDDENGAFQRKAKHSAQKGACGKPHTQQIHFLAKKGARGKPHMQKAGFH